MSKFRVFSFLLCFVLVFGVFGGLVGDGAALAAREDSRATVLALPNQEQPQIEEKLTLGLQYPVLEAKSGEQFTFKVELSYLGLEDRTFELNVTTPQNWISQIQPEFESTAISAIRLKALQSYPDKVKVIVVPLPWALPEPGEYTMTLEARSGDLVQTIDLKAVVTAQYALDFYTETGRLNTEATVGKENHVALKLRNSGTANVEKVTFTSTNKPEGWIITFNPENIDTLQPELAQDVDVVIKPAPKAIAGDYMITLKADSQEINETLELRVTVLTPTIWGWVGIGIVLVVIAGLAVLFRQLGRR